MENQDLKPENVGLFNVTTLALILAKQTASYDMLAEMLAITRNTSKADVLKDYDPKVKAHQSDLIKKYGMIDKI